MKLAAIPALAFLAAILLTSLGAADDARILSGEGVFSLADGAALRLDEGASASLAGDGVLTLLRGTATLEVTGGELTVRVKAGRLRVSAPGDRTLSLGAGDAVTLSAGEGTFTVRSLSGDILVRAPAEAGLVRSGESLSFPAAPPATGVFRLLSTTGLDLTLPGGLPEATKAGPDDVKFFRRVRFRRRASTRVP